MNKAKFSKKNPHIFSIHNLNLDFSGKIEEGPTIFNPETPSKNQLS